jgi:carbon-monoxide dehydrogenase medium subunit
MNDLFQYRAPRTREELLDLLAEHGDRAKLLAGGTDLLVDVRAGLAKPRLVVDLKQVPGYRDLGWSDAGGLVIGPAVTVNQLLEDERVRADFPLLASCGETLASYQLRNRATVVGNLTNASPCADLAPGLLCLDARVAIASKRGVRVVALADFFTGVKQTVLAPDEVVEEVVVPAAAARTRGGYRKLQRINGHDLSLVGVAVARSNGDLRLGVNSAAPTPVLVDLAGDTPPEDVAAAVRDAISPIDDVRAGREYRQFMVDVFVRRLLEEVEE